jgi:hypothetical protein
MGARTLALAAVAASLVACADLVTPVAHSTTGAAATVRISVTQRDVHGVVQAHDAIRYIRITGAGTDVRKVLQPVGVTRVRLPATGTYLAVSWTRACGDTCATLHEASDPCSTSFSAMTGAVTDLELRSSRAGACSLTVGS